MTGEIFLMDDTENLIPMREVEYNSEEILQVLLAKYPQLRDRSIIIGSFGKTFHVTGWKTGYLIAPENITHEIRKIHQFVVFASNTPVQYAIAEFLQDKNNYLNISRFYQDKRDKFLDALKDSGLELIPSSGTYFQNLDFSLLSDEEDTVLAETLLKKFGVASIPLSAFYHDKYNSSVLRFCFAKEDKTLEQAASKIIEFCKSFDEKV